MNKKKISILLSWKEIKKNPVHYKWLGLPMD